MQIFLLDCCFCCGRQRPLLRGLDAGSGAWHTLNAVEVHNLLLQNPKPSYCWSQRMLIGLPGRELRTGCEK